MKKLAAGILAVTLVITVGTVSVFALGPRFVDNNSDGICDNRTSSGSGQKNGNGQGFADEDGDGVCDNRTFAGNGQKNGNGQGFADEDVCDNQTAAGSGCGRGNGNGRHGRNR
mgnify:CR=1 FL=1